MLGKVLIVVISVTFGLSFARNPRSTLRSQLNFLEHQFKQESLWTRSKLLALQDIVSAINDTTIADGELTDTPKNVGESLKKIDELTGRLKAQEEKMKIVFKGLASEKAQMRLALKVMDDVVRENIDSVLQLKMVMGKTSDQGKNFQEQLDQLNDELDESEVNNENNNQALMKQFQSKINEQNEKLTALIQNTIETFQPKESCPNDWRQVDDVCFILFDEEAVTWDQAKEKCEDLGAQLFEAENRVKRQVLGDIEVWIGGSNFGGTWQWVGSNRDIQYLPWSKGQPNNIGKKQHCMEVYRRFFNDENCNVKNFYACQKPL